jgi:hypothetical protein
MDNQMSATRGDRDRNGKAGLPPAGAHPQCSRPATALGSAGSLRSGGGQ